MQYVIKKCVAILVFSIVNTGLLAQEVIPTSGGTASGSGGSASYTIGQMIYTTNNGVNGSVSQGIQQPYEISVVSGIEEHVKDFTPIVRFYEFGDSSINIKVFFKVYRYGDQWPIFHEFIKQLLVRYNKEGINIPFPIRTLYHMNNIEPDTK